MPILLNKTIRLFLDSIGRREEYEFYLRKFAADESAAFAILVPEAQGFEEVASVFTFDLLSLLRMELFPVLLLAGKTAPGLRTAIEQGDHPYEFMEIDLHSRSSLPSAIEFLRACREKGRAGVLYAPGTDRATALLNTMPEIAARLHIIRVQGGLHTASGEPLYFYHTTKSENIELNPEDRPIVETASALLEAQPRFHISVASPWDLLEELFTVKGAGCVIRRGSRIRRVQDVQTIDRERMAELLEDSFGRKLKDEKFLSDVSECYVEEGYRGSALLESTDKGFYLSKFAVGTQARGEGLANELWNEIIRDHERLFWRARVSNPINHWYEKRADGLHKSGDWKVFWRRIQPCDIEEVIQYSLSRRDDFA